MWNVKTLGRMAEDAEGTLWMGSAACEISFRTEGAGCLSLVLKGDATCTDPAPEAVKIRPRYAVYLDGTKIQDECLSEAEKEITVFDGPAQTGHTVRLVKLSECSQSLLGLKEIRTDGQLVPLPEKELKLEFIGDSITCGYGVEGLVTDTFSTATENAEKAYAFLAAKALDADAVMTAISGCGLISGYTEGEINGDNLMLPYYEKTGRNVFVLPGGKKLQNIPWDFSSFRPDWIIINLGNNDLSWTKEIPEREAAFGERYQELLTMVRRNNPEARILCVLGVEGEQLTAAMTRAAEEWRTENEDDRIRHMLLPKMNEEQDGAGADHHPSEKTQKMLSELVAGKIRELSGLQ